MPTRQIIDLPIGFVIALAFAILVAGGCGGDEANDSSASPSANTTTGAAGRAASGSAAGGENAAVPANAAFRVGDKNVGMKTFRHFLKAECLKYERLFTPPPNPSPEPFPCGGRYAEAQAGTLRMLILYSWYVAEAKRQRVPVTNKKLMAQTEKFRRTGRFVGNKLTFAEYSRKTGMTADDLAKAVQLLQLPGKLVPQPAATLNEVLRRRYAQLTVCSANIESTPECGSQPSQ